MIIFLRNQSITPTLIFFKKLMKKYYHHTAVFRKKYREENVEFFERAAQKNWVMKLS